MVTEYWYAEEAPSACTRVTSTCYSGHDPDLDTNRPGFLCLDPFSSFFRARQLCLGCAEPAWQSSTQTALFWVLQQ